MIRFLSHQIDKKIFIYKSTAATRPMFTVQLFKPATMKLQFMFVVFCIVGWADACTETTAGGTHAPAAGSFCSGDLIFEDNFDVLDTEKWRHDVTMGGGGNWEVNFRCRKFVLATMTWSLHSQFQWYSKDPINSYTENGILHLKPTFTADSFSEEFLISGRVVIPPEECTQGEWDGCDRQGTPDQPINPIRSARIDSSNSFHFKYGKLEVRAKNPSGDWIWPAIWAYPKWESRKKYIFMIDVHCCRFRHIVYGGWPLSGEIDLMETRGNEALYTGGNINVGTQQIGSTLHFGPQWNVSFINCCELVVQI